MLVDKGADVAARNHCNEDAQALGLDAALSLHEEQEANRLRHLSRLAEQRQSKAAALEEERILAQDRADNERAWREKLLDEHAFEHLDGWGGGGAWLSERSYASEWAWESVDETLEEDDWWAHLERQMQQRAHKFSQYSRCPSSAPLHSRRPEPAKGGGAGGSGFAHYREQMAWERAQAAGDTRASRPEKGDRVWVAGADDEMKYAERMAQHAAAWQAFLDKASNKVSPAPALTCPRSSLGRKRLPPNMHPCMLHRSISCAQASISFDDVPFPRPPTGSDLAKECLMLPPGEIADAAARGKAVREGLRRWHPDKFGQRFGALLLERDRQRILEKVREVSQALTAAL